MPQFTFTLKHVQTILSGSSKIQTHNHLVRNRTLNHLAIYAFKTLRKLKWYHSFLNDGIVLSHLQVLARAWWFISLDALLLL